MNVRHALYLVTAIGSTLTATAQASAQQVPAPEKWADTIATEIDRASLSGNTARLDAAVALANRVAAAYPNDGLILHYQGYALYRQALQQSTGGAAPKATLELAQGSLQRSLATHPLAETHMLLAMIDGQLIVQDPSRAMELGMDSQSEQTAAMSLGPNNPRVWLLRGQAAMFTPEEYGGGLAAAETQLKHAVELFAKDAPRAGEPAWGRAEAYLWLGQVYAKKGDKSGAAAMYARALDLVPDYAYARMLAGPRR